MAPVVSFVGWSEVGKTTLIEQVVRQLKEKQFKVAVIKHTCHEIQFDAPGKDTWKFRQAGSDVTVLSGPSEFVLARRDARELQLSEICTLIGPEVDIILTEGYKAEGTPRIEVRRRGSAELKTSPDNLVAVVTDETGGCHVPQFRPTDSDKIATFLIDRFIRPHQEAS